MEFGLGSYGFGFLAGLLSSLSPCVLPLIPILIGSALNAHRRAPLALAGGLALSYAILGTAIAWLGASAGIDTSIFRKVGAIILGALGIVLMSSTLQQRFTSATSGIGTAGNTLVGKINLAGLRGQFAVGLVLGIIWSPCVGPTLGAAIVLASQGSQLPQVALLMGIFGAGAAFPIVALSYASREAITKSRANLMQAGKTGKMILGGILIAVAALILSGVDKQLEEWLTDQSPQWLTNLTTRF